MEPAGVSTDAGECLDPQSSGRPCVSKATEALIAEFPAGGAGTLRGAAKELGCSTEACILTHPRFLAFAQKRGVPPRAVEAELKARFKPPGPRDSTDLLDNFKIDAVLQGWAQRFPRFYNFPFCMMDFYETRGALATTDVASILRGEAPQTVGAGAAAPSARPCDTFACVLNTDVSSGRGKHWVAVFGDCRGRDWSVEYFNSAGNPPPPPVTRWMEEAAEKLRALRGAEPGRYGQGGVAAVPVTDLRHQESQTECGVYVLYYIRRRLEGAPYAVFQETPTADDEMMGFRRHLFRQPEWGEK